MRCEIIHNFTHTSLVFSIPPPVNSEPCCRLCSLHFLLLEIFAPLRLRVKTYPSLMVQTAVVTATSRNPPSPGNPPLPPARFRPPRRRGPGAAGKHRPVCSRIPCRRPSAPAKCRRHDIGNAAPHSFSSWQSAAPKWPSASPAAAPRAPPSRRQCLRGPLSLSEI